MIEGLDDNYNQIEETVTVGGTGTKTFSRVFRAFMESTDNTSDVEISIKAVHSRTHQGRAWADSNGSLHCAAGKMGFSLKFTVVQIDQRVIMLYSFD